MTALLETHGVSKYYGEFRALDDVSISLQEGELVSIVGPNGAGKTTLVNVLTGLLKPSAGNVFFMGSDIAGVGPVLLAERGLARAFQLIQIFPRLSVAETISTAVITRQRKRWKLFTSFAADAAVVARVKEIAEIFGLHSRLHATAAISLKARRSFSMSHPLSLSTPRSSSSMSRPQGYRRPRNIAS